MISFLFPALLAALAAIAVPIIIHFFYRRQLKVVPISTLRFLKIAEETLPRQPRLQYLLLLLLRCLLVALLAFFLAKPYLSRNGGSGAGKPIHRLVLVDRSLSMSEKGAEKTPADLAAKTAGDLVRDLRYQDLSTPLAFDENPVPLTDPRNAAHPQAAAALEATKSLPRATSPRHAMRAVIRYANQPSERSARNEAIILTDLRASDVPDWIDGLTRAREESALSRVVLVPCVAEPRANFAITSARLIQAGAASSANQALAVRVISSVPQPFERKVEVTVNDQVVGTFPARSEKGDPAVVEAPLPVSASGVWKGSARLIEDDPLPADNQRHFCFKPSRSDRIFLVDGAPSNIRSLTETYYLMTALDTLPEDRSLDVGLGSLDQLPWDNLDRFGTIFIANVARFTPDQAAKIGAFVRGGGNVIVTLGDLVDADNYNRTLGPDSTEKILPSALGSIHGDAGRRVETYFLGDFDPGFDGFDLGEDARPDAFRQTRFFSYFQFEKTDPQAHVLARFNTGDPALVQQSIGDGRVYLFVSSVAANWNDFPLRPTYLPFWRNFLTYLVHLGAPPRQFLVGETARVQLTSREADRDKLQILAPDKEALKPLLAADAILLPNVAAPGLYRVVDAGGAERDPGFAVNVTPRESFTAPAGPEDLAKLKAAGFEIVPASDVTALAALAKPSEANAVPLAAWVALLAVIAAAGEWVFANKLSREGD